MPPESPTYQRRYPLRTDGSRRTGRVTAKRPPRRALTETVAGRGALGTGAGTAGLMVAGLSAPVALPVAAVAVGGTLPARAASRDPQRAAELRRRSRAAGRRTASIAGAGRRAARTLTAEAVSGYRAHRAGEGSLERALLRLRDPREREAMSQRIEWLGELDAEQQSALARHFRQAEDAVQRAGRGREVRRTCARYWRQLDRVYVALAAEGRAAGELYERMWHAQPSAWLSASAADGGVWQRSRHAAMGRERARSGQRTPAALDDLAGALALTETAAAAGDTDSRVLHEWLRGLFDLGDLRDQKSPTSDQGAPQ